MIRRIALLTSLAVAAAAAALCVANEHYVAGILSVIAVIILGIMLLKAMSRSDRDVELLLDAVKNNDISIRLTNPDSRVARSLNQIADILHRERRKAAESECTYSMILQAVSAGVIVTDSRGYVVKINDAALRMFGFEVLTHIDRMAAIDPELPSVLAGSRAGSRFQMTVSGNTLSVRRNVVVLVSEAVIGGEDLKVFVFDDIAGELESREVESWSRLTRVLIHEIINSLTPVTSIAHTLLSSPESGALPQNIRKGLDTIGAMSESLTEFANNFRTLSYLPSVNAHPIELRPMLENMVTAAHSTAPDRIAIRLAHCDPDLMIYADAALTARVITNILSNALVAVDGVKDAEISIAAYCNSDDSVTIDISNNGDVIDQDTAENIFVPFFTTRPDGQGIGLALCRQIMKAQGGNVALLPYGADGLTVFRITFP